MSGAKANPFCDLRLAYKVMRLNAISLTLVFVFALLAFQDLDPILDSIEVSTDVTDDIDLVASDSAALMQNCLDEN